MKRASAITAAAVLAVAVAYPVLDAVDLVPGVLTSDLSVRESAWELPAVPTSVPAAPSLEASAPAPVPTKLAAEVADELAAPALGKAPGAMVIDATTGDPLLTIRDKQPRTPASTTKVLTAAAVAARTDLTRTLKTRVVEGEKKALVLVADGDNLLAAGKGNPYATAGRAGLADLAAATARTLEGTTPPRGGYRLLLDDAVAAGPAVAPEWSPADLAAGYTAPVAMLGLATDRALPGNPTTADPAMTAATAFAAALREAGVPVAGAPTRARGAAAPEARELGKVESAPLGDVLGLALDDSDNALTEAVARRAFSERGVPTTFEATGAHVTEVLRELGVDTTGMHLVDASGLSRSSRASVKALAQTVQLASSGDHPGFARIVDGLPVAGLTGTLHDRFVAPGTEPARGIARAKTGTLTGVGGLAGTVVNKDGRLLTYVVLADQAPSGAALETRAALDRFVAALTTCGCR